MCSALSCEIKKGFLSDKSQSLHMFNNTQVKTQYLFEVESGEHFEGM